MGRHTICFQHNLNRKFRLPLDNGQHRTVDDAVQKGIHFVLTRPVVEQSQLALDFSLRGQRSCKTGLISLYEKRRETLLSMGNTDIQI